MCVCVCVCVCYNLGWMDAWEPGCETKQRLRCEAMSKQGHGTYYWCLHGLHIRGNPNHWLQLDATTAPLSMPEVHAGPSSLDLQSNHDKNSRAKRASDPKMLLSRGGQLLVVLIETVHQRHSASQALPRPTVPCPTTFRVPHTSTSCSSIVPFWVDWVGAGVQHTLRGNKVSSDLTLRASDLATWELLPSH